MGPVVVEGAAEEGERSRSFRGRTPFGDVVVSDAVMGFNYFQHYLFN